MLADKPIVEKPTTAYPLDHTVWMAGALLCPSCTHELRAADLDADDDGIRLICRQCHVNLITVEPN